MKKILLLSVMFIFTACGNQPDSGRWSGDAVYTDDYGRVASCSNIQLDITHNDEFLDIDKSVSNCNQPTYMWGPAALRIQGSGIWYNQELVGTAYRNGSGHVEFYNVFNDIRVNLDWQRSGSYLVYTEEVHGTFYHYKITGTLLRTFH